jgi:protoporphyrinogen oxidase
MNEFDVAVLGAGPSGLTAAYCLGKAGARVAVLERAPQCGGLMRGIKRGDFNFDLGRKELYSRFPEVHALWTELLGADYREYPHRVGVLYGGKILEKDGTHKGKLRGMSLPQVAAMGASYVASQLKPGSREARSMEDFFVLRYGRAYYDTFVHGYTLKFEGRSPAEMPHAGAETTVPRFGFARGQKQQLNDEKDRLFSGQSTWRHPAKGTQQIVDALETGSRQHGIEFLLDTEVLGLAPDPTSAHRIRFRRNGEESDLAARHIISSVPLPLLMGLLEGVPADLRIPPKEEKLFKKSTALVYLLANGEPRFPHNWLEVTDRKLNMGRVVNYATWNGDMVPKGKTGLCIEFFTLEGDPVMDLDKEGLYQLAVKEASANGLIDPAAITDHLVIQLPKVNAATGIHERKQAWLEAASRHIEALPRFFETNRPGMDRATLAGIDAAEACVTGQPVRRRSLAASDKEL